MASTHGVKQQAWDALEARELIKVTVQREAPYDSAREACGELCELVHAEPVQCIGMQVCYLPPCPQGPASVG